MKHEVHAAEPVDFELDIPDIESFPMDQWEGQTITMLPGAYQVGWSLMSERKGKYKGCRIRTYRLDFANESPEPFDGITGKMTVHTRRSKGSLRSMIDMKVDTNEDGKFSKKEIMLSSSREGYKVKDQITDYVSFDYEVALSLRQLESTGKILFEWNEIRYGAPMIEFDNQGEGEKNNFEAYFADPYADEFIVC